MCASNRLDRREFLGSVVAVAATAGLTAQDQPDPSWGGPVLDIHLHLRPNIESNFAHIEGAGVAKAVLLTGVAAQDRAKEAMAKYPGRFVRFASIDVTQPDAVALLTKAVKDGAIGFGEIKSQVEADGPEMRRVYDAAAELGVPITIHFQEVEQAGSQGTFNRGLKRFDAILKAYPKTTFIGHADAFWANVSANYAADTAYPSGPIVPGGVTDKFLGDYANLYADMSANSANNFLRRDPEFAGGFLRRHQSKLMFGSDCPCADGRGTPAAGRQGGGAAPAPVPGAPARPLAGKCVARETLTALRRLAPADVFTRITWQNGTKLLKIQA
jgi:predicted TIM-barrel fold metal-dependent hydrolase